MKKLICKIGFISFLVTVMCCCSKIDYVYEVSADWINGTDDTLVIKSIYLGPSETIPPGGILRDVERAVIWSNRRLKGEELDRLLESLKEELQNMLMWRKYIRVTNESGEVIEYTDDNPENTPFDLSIYKEEVKNRRYSYTFTEP